MPPIIQLIAQINQASNAALDAAEASLATIKGLEG
jgi:hypothetical protein